MRLVSFELRTPAGTLTRIGAVLADGRYADLQSAYRAVLADNGASKEGVARLAAATIPSDMVAFIENGVTALDAAQSALDWVATKGDTSSDATLAFSPDAVKLLSPIPRPPWSTMIVSSCSSPAMS